MNYNLSTIANDKTAKTNSTSAQQRAQNLYILGSKVVLELCVGPSLRVLEEYYNQLNIQCYGNDIDIRWKEYYSEGNWIIGDCLNINYPNNIDTLIFAPPLSIGCSGKREDSLNINSVYPNYKSFIDINKDNNLLKVLVLPARSLSSRCDKLEYHALLNYIQQHSSQIDINILTEGSRRIRKYIDVYYK
jgi:hypothetical protein